MHCPAHHCADDGHEEFTSAAAGVFEEARVDGAFIGMEGLGSFLVFHGGEFGRFYLDVFMSVDDGLVLFEVSLVDFYF